MSTAPITDFSGKRVLVTGGARGIGRAIVLAFARNRADVIFCYRHDHAAANAVLQIATAFGGNVMGVQADVTDPDAVVALVAQAQGHVDVLVNNVGSFPAARVVEMTPTEWDKVVRANLYSVFYCCQAVLAAMIAAGGGAIINITSMAGQRGSARHADYAAAKGGVLAFTRSLAREVVEYNIRFNAVSPGRIFTDLRFNEQTAHDFKRWMVDKPARRLGTAEELADAVLFLTSPARSYIIGETIAVNGGLLME